MATNIQDIVQRAGTAVSTRITNAQVYDYEADSINQFPAVVVRLEPFDPSIAFGGNSFEGTLRITFLLERAENREAWLRLYQHMDSTGSGTSVIAALRADGTLGTSVDSSMVARVENIGTRPIGGGVYIGFDVLVPFLKTVT